MQHLGLFLVYIVPVAAVKTIPDLPLVCVGAGGALPSALCPPWAMLEQEQTPSSGSSPRPVRSWSCLSRALALPGV